MSEQPTIPYSSIDDVTVELRINKLTETVRLARRVRVAHRASQDRIGKGLLEELRNHIAQE